MEAVDAFIGAYSEESLRKCLLAIKKTLDTMGSQK
jgi:hypothetical protein